MAESLVLIDGHALAYRMYFALPRGAFTTMSGEPTNATYGFARTLLDIITKMAPDYLAVSFDRGMSGRDELYPDYKGTRERMESDLRLQIDRIRELVEAFNIPILELEGYEADDVLGTATLQAERAGVESLIITGDRDMTQLVDEMIRLQLPGRKLGQVKIYDVERVREEFGIEPAQIPDWKGLVGDPSDNIPGVKGIGAKTATKLLQRYGSLEGIYEHLDEIKGAVRKKLEDGRDDAFLSRDLARIRRDLPVTLDLDACRTVDFERERVAGLFRQLEFRSLMDRLPEGKPAQMTLFGPSVGDEELAPTHTVIVRDKRRLLDLVERLRRADAITVDTETTDTDQMRAELVGIALTDRAGIGYYIPVGHAEGHQLSFEDVARALGPLLSDPNVLKYGHNAKYDYVVLRRHGLDLAPITFDTMIAEWLCNPASHNLGLKNLAWARLGVEMTHIEELIGKRGKNQLTMDAVAIEQVAPYAAADVDMTRRLVDVLEPELREKRVWDLFTQVEMPLVPVLADMEMHGVLLDTDYLAEMSRDLAERLASLEREIYELVGYEFNINSTRQLSEALFGKLMLPTEGLKKTQSGHISTAAAVLEEIKHYHPVIPVILRYRELSKLKNTYVDRLPELVNPETGRVHTSFNQTGTVTGRLSSSDPNLQNIPVRTEMGARVRRAFIAPPGHLLLSADYSQIELRVLAHISQDQALLEAFRRGQDIHATTAAAVYGIPLDQVTKEQRRYAKTVNFGLLYGMSPFRLARESDLTLAEAEAFVRAYFERFPGVRRYLDSVRREVAEKGYVETLLGRRRYFPIFQEENKRVSKIAIQQAEREAINMPIQGTAADIIKLAMVRLHRRLREDGFRSRMILQVHDELVLEVPESELEPVRELVREVMENAMKLDVALKVDVKVGPDWQQMS